MKVLSMLFIASLTCYLLLFNFGDFQMIDIVHAIWIVITIGAIVLPWKDFKGISEIRVENKKRVDTIATILIVICIILGVSCSVIAYYVLTTITDINRFKYVDGASEFYYSLGIDMKGFILTTLLYPLGYLLVPFVFYYLSQKRIAKAVFCFIGSLLPIAYGLTYFSRAHMTHVILVYIAAYFLLKNTLPKLKSKMVRRIIVLVGVAAVIGFASISTSRFEDHEYDTGNRDLAYTNRNSTIISTIDYFSQWWPCSQEMFRRFDGRTMHGSIIMQSTATFFNTISFNIIPNDAKGRRVRRETLFKEFLGSFIGVGAYTLYDIGPLFGLLLYALYGWYVRKQKPKGRSVSMSSLLIIFVLIQIPLFAIFYSVFDVVILSLIFLIPILAYMRPRRTIVKATVTN